MRIRVPSMFGDRHVETEHSAACRHLTLVCWVCDRHPDDIYDRAEVDDYFGDHEHTRVELAMEDGTYNYKTKHFTCNTCYVKIGMPSSPEGWKAP